jgi:hypothetical protein
MDLYSPGVLSLRDLSDLAGCRAVRLCRSSLELGRCLPDLSGYVFWTTSFVQTSLGISVGVTVTVVLDVVVMMTVVVTVTVTMAMVVMVMMTLPIITIWILYAMPAVTIGFMLDIVMMIVIVIMVVVMLVAVMTIAVAIVEALFVCLVIVFLGSFARVS